MATDRTQQAQQLKDIRDQIVANADTEAAEVQELRRLINKKQDRADIGNNE